MINITMGSFDKAFWVSSTNMRNLMRAVINIDINIGQVEDNVGDLETDVGNMGQTISDIYSLINDINNTLAGLGSGAIDPTLTGLAAQVGVIDNRLTAAESELSLLKIKVNTLDSNISTLNTSVDFLLDQNIQNWQDHLQIYNELKTITQGVMQLTILIGNEIQSINDRLTAAGIP